MNKTDTTDRDSVSVWQLVILPADTQWKWRGMEKEFLPSLWQHSGCDWCLVYWGCALKAQYRLPLVLNLLDE